MIDLHYWTTSRAARLESGALFWAASFASKFTRPGGFFRGQMDER
jgi:hypothetical protein